MKTSAKDIFENREIPGFNGQAVFYILPIVLGSGLAVLMIVLPINFLLLGLGGLLFAYLLFFHIDIAIILALLIQTTLSRFNYMGQGTPFHPNGIMGMAIIGGTIFHFAFHKVDQYRFHKIEGFSAFLIICLFSLLNIEEHFLEGLTVMFRLATAYSIFAILVYRLNSISKVKWVLGAIIAAQIIPTISGLLMYAGKTGLLFTDETMRLGNSGVGIYLSMIAVLCLVFFLSIKHRLVHLLFGALSALFLAGLFFSFGRSGWIGFVVSMIIVSLTRFKRLVFILPVLLVIIVLIIPGFSQRFSDITFGNMENSSSTFAQRLEFWQAALRIHQDHPILGVGIGVGRYLAGEYRGGDADMIHNDYLSILLETGFIGLLIFILWQAQWLGAMINSYQKANAGFDQVITLGVLTIYTSSLIMRITDNMILDSYDMYPLCALVAAVLAIPRIRNGENSVLSPA